MPRIKQIKPKTGEITIAPTGDVVIGVPAAEAIVVINPDLKEKDGGK